MHPKTSTILKELTTGDRFYLMGDKEKIPYQVTIDSKTQLKPCYNLIDTHGVKAWTFDKEASGDRPVIFLRHTLPQPHQQYTIQQLNPGDVFFLPGDIITEYTMVDDDSDEYNALKLNEDQSSVVLPPGTAVIYIRTIKQNENVFN